MTNEQEIEMLREELRKAGGVFPEPNREVEEVVERPRMEDIHATMSDEDRARTLKHILNVLRGEQ